LGLKRYRVIINVCNRSKPCPCYDCYEIFAASL
jgi:hypothetical protein